MLYLMLIVFAFSSKFVVSVISFSIQISIILDVVFIDDGWLLMSRDLVHDFMTDRDQHLCTPFAWFTLQKWISKQLKVRRIHWYSDQRIYHNPPVSKIFHHFRDRHDICRRYISLHGAYPKEMAILQQNLEKEQLKGSDNFGIFFPLTYHIPPINDRCRYQRVEFNYSWFKPPYYYEPIPCKQRPIWNGSAIWAGRGGFNGRYDV